MIYSVEISTQAERDLRSIYEYIAFELQSVQNATEQLARLEESIFVRLIKCRNGIGDMRKNHGIVGVGVLCR